MNKQLLLLVFAGLSLSAVHAQKPTVILGGEELTVDTLFHAKVGPGTTQTQLHLSGANPLDIYYLTVDRTTPGVSIRTICPGGKIAGSNRTSAMAQAESTDSRLYFAGTNGDFYYTGGKATDGTSLVGTPTYSAAVNGETYKSSGAGYQFSVDAEGIARVCRLSWHNGTATSGDRTVPFRAVNVDGAPDNAVTLYTPRGWTSPCQGHLAGKCAEVSARLVEGDSFISGGSFRLEVTSEVTSTGDKPVPADGCVIMGRGTGAEFIRTLSVGDIVTMDQVLETPEGERIRPMEIVSGNPKNIGGGVNLNSEGERGDASARHPRTGIGVSADGNTIVMMVIDGRGASRGVTTGMLGDMLLYAGAYEGVNIDGGGSSTLYTAALGVRNTCSDGNERSVGNGVFAAVDGDVNDTRVASLAFADWRFDAPRMGLYTPRVFAFNAAGVLIDNDFKDYTLSCPESLGEIISDGHSLLANGTSSGVLTARYGNAEEATIPVYITETEVAPRVPEVLLDGHSTYTIELEAEVLGAKVPVSPVAYRWESSDVAVATVDAEGVVTPVADGTCTMTGRDGNSEVSLTIKVESPAGNIVPVETDHSAWDFKKTLVSTLETTPLENGFTLDYKMGSSARGSNIRLTDKKLMPSRPDAVRIRIASALAMPTQLSLTITAANRTKSDIVAYKELPAAAPAEWTLRLSDVFDTNDAAIYPLEFVSLTISLGDAAKSTGKLEIPGIEMVYDKGQTGVDNIVVENPADAPAEYFTLEGIRVEGNALTPGVYIVRRGNTATKILVK